MPFVHLKSHHISDWQRQKDHINEDVGDGDGEQVLLVIELAHARNIRIPVLPQRHAMLHHADVLRYSSARSAMSRMASFTYHGSTPKERDGVHDDNLPLDIERRECPPVEIEDGKLDTDDNEGVGELALSSIRNSLLDGGW